MLSVLVPTRNRSLFLDKCLDSLVSQSTQPDEVVVVDNSSTDLTKKVVNCYKNLLPIRYVLEKRVGIPYARNSAVQKASGDILAFIDDDCVADRHWVRNIKRQKLINEYVIQGKTLNANPESLVASLVHYCSEAGIRGAQSKAVLAHNYAGGYPVLTDYADTKNLIIKKSFLNSFKIPFDPQFAQYNVGEDVDLAIKFTSNKIYTIYVPNIKVKHHYKDTLLAFIKRAILVGRCDYAVIKMIKEKHRTRYEASKKVKEIFGLDTFKKMERKRKILFEHQNRKAFHRLGEKRSIIYKFLAYLLFYIHLLFKRAGYIFEWSLKHKNS